MGDTRKLLTATNILSVPGNISNKILSKLICQIRLKNILFSGKISNLTDSASVPARGLGGNSRHRGKFAGFRETRERRKTVRASPLAIDLIYGIDVIYDRCYLRDRVDLHDRCYLRDRFDLRGGLAGNNSASVPARGLGGNSRASGETRDRFIPTKTQFIPTKARFIPTKTQFIPTKARSHPAPLPPSSNSERSRPPFSPTKSTVPEKPGLAWPAARSPD